MNEIIHSLIVNMTTAYMVAAIVVGFLHINRQVSIEAALERGE
jgi:hypothetical protein